MDITHLRAKTCTKCGEVKPVSEFGKRKSCKFGINSECLVCTYLRGLQYAKDNSEKVKLQRAEHYQANRDTIIANARAYAIENKEATKAKGANWRANNKEKAASYSKDWRSNNAGKGRAYNAKRKALKKSATACWADMSEISKIYEESARLTKETGILYHVDHVIPLKHPLVCGLHVENNLQILTAFDNMSKHNYFDPLVYNNLSNI